MTQAGGWAGKILWVDLSERKISQIPTSDFEPHKYIGGIGLNCKIFWELGCPKGDALHPDNPLIFSNGPLAGASGPFSRATVSAIAPQAYPDELFSYSGCGGKFPAELKYAGYDAIVVTGKADAPVYLIVQDADATLADAGDLWGLDTFETQHVLTDRHPGASAHVIGPAGENLSPTAIIITETTGAAGQGGYGAVMGSKNLKAVVTRGTGNLKIARPEAFLDLIQEVKEAGEWVIRPSMVWARYPNCGAHGGNYRVTETMTENHLKKFTGCHGCPYQCHGVYDVPGIGKGAQMCGDAWYGYFNPSLEGMWEANLMSQKLGINNFELLGMLLILGRLIPKGIVTKEDLGLSSIPMIDRRSEPEHGTPADHHKFLKEFIGGIAQGTSIFSQGLSRAVAQLGPEAAEAYDRVCPAWGNILHHLRGVGEALHWATDTRDPANSCQDYVRKPDMGFGYNAEIADHFGVPGGYLASAEGETDQNIYDNIERETIWVQHNQSLKNSLHICELASMPGHHFHPPDMDLRIYESRLLSTVTGLDYNVEALWEAGERIYNMRRAVMVLRENRSRDKDTLAPVFFEEIVPGCMAEPLDKEKFETVKDRYYELRGWSVDTGWPMREKLESLGMKDIADGLESAGKLG